MIHSPIFSFTSDIDWASEACIEDLADLLNNSGIKPTFMATHKSAIIDKLLAEGKIDVGLHPNFLPGSTHGADVPSVVDHVCSLYPKAEVFRSHGFVDSTQIVRQMGERGIQFDSNLCLYLQADLAPLRHAAKSCRLPVFWEDDVHWTQEGSWDFSRYRHDFLTTGLKIINIHPVHVALNTPNEAFYQSVKSGASKADAEFIRTHRHDGQGVRTFLLELLAELKKNGVATHTLGEIYRKFPVDKVLATHDETAGLVTPHTDEEHTKYWSTSDEEKQAMLHDDYERRNAREKYATSRDANLRELEIQIIGEIMTQSAPSPLVDIGCGNGYTLISLADRFPDLEMLGVDYSANLIEGTQYLLEEAKLNNVPQFIQADAFKFLADRPDNSVGTLLTERFLINMPSQEIQENLLRDIYRILKPGGRFIMCEAAIEGHLELNRLREVFGQDAIPENSANNLSSLRFKNAELHELCTTGIGFKAAGLYGFSQYFQVSRVLHPHLVAPLSPRFDAPINTAARKLQESLPFEPGVGSNQVWVWEK